MALTEVIQAAVKANKAIIGYNETINYIKTNNPKLIVVANNLPLSLRKEIEHNMNITKGKLEVINGTSKELGVICGKPFPISALAIKG